MLASDMLIEGVLASIGLPAASEFALIDSLDFLFGSPLSSLINKVTNGVVLGHPAFLEGPTLLRKFVLKTLVVLLKPLNVRPQNQI